MTESKSELQTLLEEAGDYDCPAESDKQRVRARLVLSLTAGAAGGAAVTSTAGQSWASTFSALSSLPAAAKGGLLASVVAGGWLVVDQVPIADTSQPTNLPEITANALDSIGEQADAVATGSFEDALADAEAEAVVASPPAPSQLPPLVGAEKSKARPPGANVTQSARKETVLPPVAAAVTSHQREFPERVPPAAPSEEQPLLNVAEEAEYLLRVRRALGKSQLDDAERALRAYFRDFPSGALRAEARTLKSRLSCRRRSPDSDQRCR